MKKLLLLFLAVFVIPGIVSAEALVGVFVDGKIFYSPAALTPFNAYLYILQDEYEVTGIQYSLTTPTDPGHGNLLLVDFDFPYNHSVDIGDPWNGHAVSYNPPVSCYPNGYGMLVKYEFMILDDCYNNNGDLVDYRLDVVGHPDSGLEHPVYGGLYATSAPDHEGFPVTGLQTYFCPFEVDAQERSWGAIKSMYK